MLKIGVLSSTKASDLQAVIEAINKNELGAKITVVISDKKDAYCLERAKMYDIPQIHINAKDKTREDFDKEVAETLDHHSVDIILMIGYMRIVSSWFVSRYRYKIMNIHPSLLPAFAGGMDKSVHQQVLDAGVKVTGCTLHFVDEGVDSGPIIMQKSVHVAKDETADTLKNKVQTAEQECIVKALQLYSLGKIKVENKQVIIDNT